MDGDRRRFNARERDELYDISAGCCAECEQPLAPGWHADHFYPSSRGGPTHTANGQALCPRCNLTKGDTVIYNDKFRPRPAQAEVLNAVRENVQQGVKQTVALLAPGSGKELLGQAVAVELRRLGLIDFVVVLTPRIGLAQQCETNWRKQRDDVKFPRHDVAEDWVGNFELFDPAGRIEFIEHIENRKPLLDPRVHARGIATTYQSLVSQRGQEAFGEFAQRHEGRFLVVVDEAQFCGDDDSGFGGGTRAGEMVKMLDHHATHTLIMTGTAERSDGASLVCCRYGEPNTAGVRPLLHDVHAGYQDGVREGYLRRYVATVTDQKVTRRDISDDLETVTNLSEDGAQLKQILRRPGVWQPLVDEVATTLREKKRRLPEYQALISCIERDDAERVAAYWRSRYPDLRVALATSDRPDANGVLRDFKTGDADVLITVRMAFIGYDCKTITVVGVLTHYRDKGHLMQLVGRGMRVLDEERFEAQSCRVIAPDDPKMQEFLEELRKASEQGIRDRGEGPDGPGTGPGPGTVVVEDTESTGTRVTGPSVDLDNTQYAAFEAARRHGLIGDPDQVHAFLQDMLQQRTSSAAPTTPAATAKSTTAPRTGKERIEELLSDTAKLVKAAVSRDYGVAPRDPGYDDMVIKLTADLNKRAGGNSGKARKDETFAHHRREVARRLYGAAQEVS